MARELVTVVAGGREFRRWKGVTIGLGAKQAARSFTLRAAEPETWLGRDWPLQPGNTVEVYATGTLILRGVIDSYAPSFSSSAHEVGITGRSKAADAIDSSAVHKTGRIENKTIEEVARELDKQGVGFKAKGISGLRKIPLVQIVPGETIFRTLDALARSQGVLLVGEADGSVAITKAGKNGRHAGQIAEGVHILEASATLSAAGKNSPVIVKGQRRLGTGKDATRIRKVVTDDTVKRFRPLIVVHDEDADPERAEERAKWHVRRAAGQSVRAQVKVYGWRDEAGALWDPTKLVWLNSPRLRIDQDMAIESASLTQDEQGTTATLSLVDPRALGGEAKDAKGDSGGQWAIGGATGTLADEDAELGAGIGFPWGDQ